MSGEGYKRFCPSNFGVRDESGVQGGIWFQRLPAGWSAGAAATASVPQFYRRRHWVLAPTQWRVAVSATKEATFSGIGLELGDCQLLNTFRILHIHCVLSVTECALGLGCQWIVDRLLSAGPSAAHSRAFSNQISAHQMSPVSPPPCNRFMHHTASHSSQTLCRSARHGQPCEPAQLTLRPRPGRARLDRGPAVASSL